MAMEELAMGRTKAFCPALSAFVLCLCAGCAFMEEDNRRLLNTLDEQVENTVITNTTAGRIAAAPVFLPVGVVAFAVDTVVIQPVMAVPPAAEDTYDALWKPRDMTPFRKMLVFVPVVAATPIVFVSDWAVRSVFVTDMY